MKSFQLKILKTIGLLPHVRRFKKAMVMVAVAFGAFMATMIVSFFCMLIIAIYFLVHLIQGR